MLKILLAEDDDNLRRLISKNLTDNGFFVVESSDGKEALDLFFAQHFDLVITDVLMPKMDGNKLTSELRKNNKDIPIIILTALEGYLNKEKGFDSGADDYMVKPVDINELLLRIRALMRRYNIAASQKIELPHLSLSLSNNVALVKGESIELTKKEFLLLFKLLSTPNKIFTRNQLLDEIWGFDTDSNDRTIDAHIKSIRARINCDDFEIVTVRGLGYKAVIR